MNLSIWKRLYTTLVIFITIILLAVGLAFFSQHSRGRSIHSSDQLHVAEARIGYNLMLISDALRAMLIEPREAQMVETEYGNIKAGMEDLKNCLQQLRQAYPQKVIQESLDRLDSFVTFTLELHIKGVMDQLDKDSGSARDFFLKSNPGLTKQRKDVMAEVKNAFEQIRSEDDDRASRIGFIAVLGLVAVLCSAFFVFRSVLSSAITIPLKQLVDVMERMRNGDFTQRVALNRQDEFGVLGEGLNRLADDLSILVGQVQRSGVQVNITATQIAATSREQQSTATEIAATTAEIGATSRQISTTSRELDITMQEVVDVAHETGNLAGSGQNGITRMENTMRQLMAAAATIGGKLAALNERAGNINAVVTTITKVADQTNLLSLNAAIEAEKAGEYGLGFAVVAMEIRRLADQTAVATYDIEKMVKFVQSAVTAGVMGMDKFSEEVRRGVEEINQVSKQLAQIISQVQLLTPRFATVSEGMHAQATGAQQISETLTQLSEAAHQTADSLRQSNLAIEQLNEAARSLQSSVARFKLEMK